MRFLSALLLLTLVACDNDDGVTDGTDAGPGAAACGNGTVEGDEACDDGNAIDVDGCLDSCVLARCGDGRIRTDISEGAAGFEACDDGNIDERDACTNSCAEAVCGDGILRRDLTAGDDGFEACDDGNADNTDSCVSDCSQPACGDGYVQANEACDDGNTASNDGCSATCLDETADSFDQDGDCFCAGDECLGSSNEDCGPLASGDCDDNSDQIYPGAEDAPDVQATDANCDGIDGTLIESIFIDLAGGDDTQDGTAPAQAVQTMDRAFELASATNRPWILVSGHHELSAPEHNWNLTAHIAGGYDASQNFGRAMGAYSTFTATQSRGLVITSSMDQTTLANLHFIAAGGSNSYAGSIALRVAGGRVQLSACQVESRSGLDGVSGAAGNQGQAGENGTAGGPGCVNENGCGNCNAPSAGQGGTSYCGRGPSHWGGNGGSPGLAVGNGQDGVSPGGALAGVGGTRGAFRGDGQDGTNGQNAAAGTSASAPLNSLSVANGVVTVSGGSNGARGGCGGSGGGGGGAGGTIYLSCNYYGGAGGGGGGGGSGGEPGMGGAGGGSSVALSLYADAQVELINSAVISGDAGRGGNGGAGGPGGAGGLGRAGGNDRFDLTYEGGRGGDGGNGGAAGHGAGGAGGASIAVLCSDNATLTSSESTLTRGTPGPGGAGAGAAGPSGIAAASRGCD